MKTFCVLVLSVVTSVFAAGQDIVRLVSSEICICFGTIEGMEEIDTKLDSCLNVALENVISLLEEEQQELLLNDQTLDSTIEDVFDKLLLYCPKIKEYILVEKMRLHYRFSDSEKAMKYYNAGMVLLESENYRKARKYLNKAIRHDRRWVFPYDELGLISKETEKYRKSIRYFLRSLAIYPEGTTALLNLAIVYTETGNYEAALNTFTLFAFLYPGNPEGFFGVARVHYLTGNLEEALEYAFYTHKIHSALQSDSVKDSQELISMIYNKLKEKGKLDIFNEKASKFGIDTNEK